ncbi:helix-turn-helix transcriptional regulator [Lysinibacillus sp. NPDC093688]|uniref:helix-turn-helix transcriptional regulator n=1 Tax=Lysinibacillus sp. NPDC093688 TaxID=3390577 RepID=UPI003D03BA1A
MNREIAIYKAKYEINNIKDYFGSDIPKRTIEVLELMYLGKTDLEISKILNLSTSTIRTHINILLINLILIVVHN